MATTAGVLSQISVSSNSAVLSSAVATGGTAPYTYQWYQSLTSGFSVGPTNILTGSTSLNINPSNLIPNTIYYYKVVASDSTSPTPVTSTSSQLAVTTTPTVLSQNTLVIVPIVGQPDMNFNYNTKSVLIDSSQTGSLYQGQAVKIVANSLGGVPRVVGCTSSTDNVFGFLNYNVKNVSFVAGQAAEVSSAGNIIWLYANAAITQGAQVCLDVTAVAAVQPTGASATSVGYALDGAASAGSLIRVELKCPTFATA